MQNNNSYKDNADPWAVPMAFGGETYRKKYKAILKQQSKPKRKYIGNSGNSFISARKAKKSLTRNELIELFDVEYVEMMGEP